MTTATRKKSKPKATLDQLLRETAARSPRRVRVWLERLLEGDRAKTDKSPPRRA